MKVLTKASMVAVAAIWAGAVLAQSPGAAAQGGHLEKLAVLLDLTEPQKPQVATILKGQHAQMRALMEQTKAAGGKPDFEALRAAHTQIQQDTLAKLSSVLSPTQLKKFQTLQQMHHGFGHRGPPGGAPAAVPQSN